MKKLLVLTLALAMVLAMATVSMAAVGLGGNLRVFFNSDEDDNYFSFDRLAISLGGDLSANNGFKSELQLRDVGQAFDVRLDHAYYYQKNLFATDELNAGYMPLSWHADKSATIAGSLGSDFRPGNSIGLKYTYFADAFSITGYVLNAENGEKAPVNTTGYDLGARVAANLIDNLTVGFGVVNNVIDEDADTSDLDLVLDAVYTYGDLGLYAEFVSQTKTVAGEDGDAENGFYLEGSYALNDKLSAYAGLTAAEDLLGEDQDRIVAGAKWQFAPATALQGELVNCNDETSIGLRLRVDF